MNSDFKIDFANISDKHDIDFVIDRPHGAEFYIFVYFEVPVEARIENRIKIIPLGSFLLFEPGFPHWYRGYKTGLCDSWIHLYGKEATEIYQRCNLPINTIIESGQPEFIRQYIARLKRETEINDELSGRNSAIIFEEMCIEINRHINRRNLMKSDKTKARHLKNFDNIRQKLCNSFTEKWTIDAMAEMAEISESRFSVLYKDFYGISPLNDLIEMRVRYARYLLSNTTLTVTQVATQCGFENVYYFSRLFKKRTKVSPGQYYLSIAETKNNL